MGGSELGRDRKQGEVGGKGAHQILQFFNPPCPFPVLGIQEENSWLWFAVYTGNQGGYMEVNKKVFYFFALVFL